MSNPSKRDSAVRKVVAIAQAIISYQLGLSVGCQRMSRTLSSLAPHEENLPTVFREYLDEVQTLPIGSERLLWDREALQENDKRLEEANRRFRNSVFDACWSLINRFTQPIPGATRNVVAIAQAIVTYQIGLSAGCKRMSRALSWLAPHKQDLPTVFDEYLKEVQDLLIGSERLHWDRNALQQNDRLLEEISQRFRDPVFEACWDLLDRFTKSHPGTTSPL